MNHLPSFQFYTGDWKKDPQLRMASAATRGIWIDLLCSMWEATERGTISGTIGQLAQLCSCTQDEFAAFLAEAEQLKFADVQRSDGSCGIVTLTNRRMVRDEKARKDSAIRMSRMRGRRTVTGQLRESCTVSSSSSSSSKNIGAVAPSPKGSSMKVSEGRKARKFSWPEGMVLTSHMRTEALRIAKELGITVDPDHEFDAWHDDCIANARSYADWSGAWRNRIRNAAKFGSLDHGGNGSRLNPIRPEPHIPNMQELRRLREADKAPPLTPEERAELQRSRQLQQGAA